MSLALEAQSVNQGGPSSHSLMSPPQAHFSQAPDFPHPNTSCTCRDHESHKGKATLSWPPLNLKHPA